MDDDRFGSLFPFTYEYWKQKTSIFTRTRSAQLFALDTAVKAYCDYKSPRNRGIIETAFGNWRKTKGEGDQWKKNDRNAKWLPFTQLYAWLNEEADTDELFGVPTGIAKDIAVSRAGLLWLFGNLDCDRATFGIITDGVLDLADAAFDYAGTRASPGAQNVIGREQTALKSLEPVFDKAADKLDERRAGSSVRAPSARTRKVDSGLLLGKTGRPLSPAASVLSDGIYSAFKKAWGDAEHLWDDYGAKTLRTLCDYLTGRFLSDAANAILSNGLGTAKGLTEFIVACCNRWKAWQGSRRTEMLPGTPVAIVDGIKRGMDLNVGAGLYKALSSGSKLVLQIAAVDVPAFSSLIVSVIEALFKAGWHLYQIRELRKFLHDAKTKYTERAVNKIYEHPFRFNDWFRSYAIKLPIVSALALNSGVVNNMYLLQMFNDGTVINQSKYDEGAKFLADLRNWSAEFITESGYKISSENAQVSKFAEPREEQHRAGTRIHLLHEMKTFLGFDTSFLGSIGLV